jgi:arginyl-tRNA synthetase
LASVSTSPFSDFRKECENTLQSVHLEDIFRETDDISINLEIPPIPQFGELSSPICFDIAKRYNRKPLEIARLIEKKIEKIKPMFQLIESVKAEGKGYLNFYANFAKFTTLTLLSAKKLDNEYGYVKTVNPEEIIVEHTSVNPVHPIHIGQSRNSVLGDTLARTLKARGHTVKSHYYIDDVGRQSALIAFGYNLLGKPKPQGKSDHFIGTIYAITSCLMEIFRLKEIIKRESSKLESEDIKRARKELDDWILVAANLKEKSPQLFQELLEKINEIKDPESATKHLLQEYEKGEEGTKKLVRGISKTCLKGFKQTLKRANIYHDSWDWESDFVWSNEVTNYLNALKKTPFVFKKGEVFEFNAELAAQKLDLKEILDVKKTQEIPSLTLGRADGTTLYTTRDISYSIWKFKKAKKVINVIGMEQKLSQLQLKIALCVLGYIKDAKNLIHFAYNLVRLPGYRMSSRKGRYIPFDEVMDEAVTRAYDEVGKRSPKLTEVERRKISEFIGVGAVKYALIETDPLKPVVFTWDRVINLEKNSGPYVQYSHARACNILKKASKKIEHFDGSLLKETVEKDLVYTISRFPEIFIDSSENLKPTVLPDFANIICEKFNKFYASSPVIKARTRELSDTRLELVNAFRITLRNVLNLIGIEPPTRM